MNKRSRILFYSPLHNKCQSANQGRLTGARADKGRFFVRCRTRDGSLSSGASRGRFCCFRDSKTELHGGTVPDRVRKEPSLVCYCPVSLAAYVQPPPVLPLTEAPLTEAAEPPPVCPSGQRTVPCPTLSNQRTKNRPLSTLRTVPCPPCVCVILRQP